jgi:hypothetical protein
VAIVAAAALAAPLGLGLFPRIRLPSIVLEIALGIVIGPQVLGWGSIHTPIQVMSLLRSASDPPERQRACQRLTFCRETPIWWATSA